MADSTLYLYTSLTAGSSHIITATSRLETILKANKIPFRAIDCATDEKARQLWGRRSKGKKLPGLVKYGQVIADQEQVEEWNEFGELKESVSSVSDIFADTPMTDNPMPPPANNYPASAMKPLVERPSPAISRSSSETRHISISEPSRDKENPAGSMRKDDSPLALAMRHAGAEAAAKAGSKKTTTSSISPSTNSKQDVPQETPHVGKIPAESAIHDPTDPIITDAKTPAQLSAEGSIRRKSIDNEGSGHSSPDSDKSNEEQVLDMRRRSSVVKSTSRLAEETKPEDVEDNEEEQTAQTHQGSSVTEVSASKIEEIEKENRILEDDEEEAGTPAKKISATNKGEDAVLKGTKPQDGKVAAMDEAGVSVGD